MYDAPGYQWRWEFLRRNPEYQEDWNKLKTDVDTAKAPENICNKWNALYMVNPELDDIEKTLANFSEMPFGVEWKGVSIAHKSYFQTGVKRLCLDEPDWKTRFKQNRKPGGKTILMQPIFVPDLKNFIENPEDILFKYLTPGAKPEKPAYAAFNLDEPITLQTGSCQEGINQVTKRMC
ncbi:DUF6499 domain-containing protein [Desulfococcaceae bacterium HSG7]|nr:DUF6499 domain-containing protein [Desulfococcaceae bacterium HSG7]